MGLLKEGRFEANREEVAAVPFEQDDAAADDDGVEVEAPELAVGEVVGVPDGGEGFCVGVVDGHPENHLAPGGAGHDRGSFPAWRSGQPKRLPSLVNVHSLASMASSTAQSEVWAS